MPKTPPADTPDDDAPEGDEARLAAVVPIERDDPEPDEVDGDKVTLVANGWVRLDIAGHGRLRFRPARFGQLRTIMDEQEAMLETIQAAADGVAMIGARLQGEQANWEKDDTLTPEDRERRRREALRESRAASRQVTSVAQTERVKLWRQIHDMLGVAGESFPADDDLPVWMIDATLLNIVIGHWQSVPLAPGPA